MTVDDDDTIIPMKEVTANPTGIVTSCDHRASFGLVANLAKSLRSSDKSCNAYKMLYLRIVYNQCSKIANTAHDATDNAPCKLGPGCCSWLVDDWTNSMRFGNRTSE